MRTMNALSVHWKFEPMNVLSPASNWSAPPARTTPPPPIPNLHSVSCRNISQAVARNSIFRWHLPELAFSNPSGRRCRGFPGAKLKPTDTDCRSYRKARRSPRCGRSLQTQSNLDCDSLPSDYRTEGQSYRLCRRTGSKAGTSGSGTINEISKTPETYVSGVASFSDTEDMLRRSPQRLP